jgi:hypothetical protein
MFVAFGAQSAWAEASTYCVKATKVTTPKKHYTGGWNDKNCTAVNATHEGKYDKLASFSESEEQQLKALLKYVKVQASGVGGKPTVQVSGANVQIVNGENKTATTNGEGNLVIGYDEIPGTQTGSHDLILGYEQTFTSFGGVIAGRGNTVSGRYASVSGGFLNTASAELASVSGGTSNTASGSVASVSGGAINIAKGNYASVSGGVGNTAEGEYSSVSGGLENSTTGNYASVSGGNKNTAIGLAASIFGGKGVIANASYEALPSCVAPGKAGEVC